jgi:uncharacterized damage-inducible protein DinB
MRSLTLLLFVAAAVAEDTPSNPLINTSKAIYAISKNDVLGAANKIPDELWSYQPTKDVRTVAQLFAHIADGQYEFCGLAAEGKSINKGIEKGRTTKADIVSALNDAFAYCDGAYSRLTDAQAADTVSFFGRKITKLGAMDFNVAHNMEHYGNLVTYMRMNGIVPPSTEPRKPANATK